MKVIKPKKCSYSKCDKFFIPFRTTQRTCFNSSCALGFTKEQEDERVNRIVKEFKVKLKKLSEYEAEAKKPFQLWVRIRDKNLPCISCGASDTELWDGGHYLKAELFSGLIFTETNCHKQCRKCNRYLNGNELAYRDGLISRYGISYVEKLEALKITNRIKVWTREELIEIKITYDLKLKLIKKGNK